MIIIESSRFKNPQAKKFIKMIDLEKHRVYLLTGTPMSTDYKTYGRKYIYWTKDKGLVLTTING